MILITSFLYLDHCFPFPNIDVVVDSARSFHVEIRICRFFTVSRLFNLTLPFFILPSSTLSSFRKTFRNWIMSAKRPLLKKSFVCDQIHNDVVDIESRIRRNLCYLPSNGWIMELKVKLMLNWRWVVWIFRINESITKLRVSRNRIIHSLARRLARIIWFRFLIIFWKAELDELTLKTIKLYTQTRVWLSSLSFSDIMFDVDNIEERETLKSSHLW